MSDVMMLPLSCDITFISQEPTKHQKVGKNALGSVTCKFSFIAARPGK